MARGVMTPSGSGGGKAGCFSSCMARGIIPQSPVRLPSAILRGGASKVSVWCARGEWTGRLEAPLDQPCPVNTT